MRDRPDRVDVARRRALVARLRLVAPGLLTGGSTGVDRDFTAIERVADLRSGRVSLWLLVLLVDTVEAFASGQAITCVHDPGPDTGHEVYAATWRPGTVVCAACVRVLLIRPDSPAARRCAACDRICGPGEVVYAGATRFGRLLFRSVCCADCAPRGR